MDDFPEDAMAEIEQRVLAQLRVFPAPFDLAACTAVVLLPTPAPLLTQILERLEQKELLRQGPATGLYECVLQENTNAADASPEDSQAWRWVRLRHARHYLAGFHSLDVGEHGEKAAQAVLNYFDQIRPHLDVIWTWVLAEAETDAVDMHNLLFDLVFATAPIEEARYDPRSERIPHWTAALHVMRNDWQQSYRIAEALNHLGQAYLATGEAQSALNCFMEQLDHARHESDRDTEAAVWANLAAAHAMLGNTEQAGRCRAEEAKLCAEQAARATEPDAWYRKYTGDYYDPPDPPAMPAISYRDADFFWP